MHAAVKPRVKGPAIEPLYVDDNDDDGNAPDDRDHATVPKHSSCKYQQRPYPIVLAIDSQQLIEDLSDATVHAKHSSREYFEQSSLPAIDSEA